MEGISLAAFDFLTARLHVRPLVDSDETLFHGLYTDPETMRFIAPPLSAEAASTAFRNILRRAQQPAVRELFLAMTDRLSLQSLGICGMSRFEPGTARVEVGILLRPAAQSRGLAAEALAALLRKVFAVLPVDEIRMRCDAQNRAIERLGVGLGFVVRATAGGHGFSSRRIWSVQRSSWNLAEKPHDQSGIR